MSARREDRQLVSPLGRIHPDAARDIGAGVRCFNAGRLPEALAHFTTAVTRRPQDAAARLLRAQAQRAAGKMAAAREDARAAAAAAPRSAAVLLAAAAELQCCGGAAESLAHVLAAARLEPRFPAARLAAAKALASAGRGAEALAHCWELLALDAAHWNSREVRDALGRALMEAGDDEKRVHEILRRAALTLNRRPAAEGFAFLAELQAALGQKERALESWRACARAPAPPQPLLLRAGLALRDGGRWKEAYRCAETASRGAPSTAALELLCSCASKLGLARQSCRAARALILLDPGSAATRLLAAGALADAGRPQAALQQARRAIALGGGASACAAAASCAKSLGRFALAVEFLEKSAAASSAGTGLRQALAAAKRLAQLPRREASKARLEMVLDLLRAACLKRPGAAQESSLAVAQALMEAGLPEQALALAREAASAAPDKAEAWALCSKLEQSFGRVARALECLEKAAVLQGWTPASRLEASALLTSLDRPREALEHCRAAAQRGRSLDELKARCSALRTLGSRSRALKAAREAENLRTPEARLWAGETFASFGRFADARRAMTAAAAAAPGSAPAWTALARLELWHGRCSEARRAARRASSADPAGVEPLVVLGGADCLEGRCAQALSLLGAALKRSPLHVEALTWTLEAQRRRGRFGEAQAALNKTLPLVAAAAQPLSILANRILLRLALKRRVSRKDWDELFSLVPWRQLGIDVTRWPSAEALEALLASMRGNRSLTPTYVYTAGPGKPGAIHLQTRVTMLELQAGLRFGDRAAVLAEFDRLIAEEPSQPYSWASRGEVCLWTGLYARARRDIERAIKLNPALPWPRVGLCAVNLLEGQLDKASEELDRAQRNGASQTVAAVWRGEIMRRRGRPHEALTRLAKGGGRPPFRLGLWLNQGLAQAEAGKPAEAAKTLKTLARYVPAFIQDAAREAGKSPQSVLARALEMLKGNRSSWMYCYVDGKGRLKHAKIFGVPVERRPPAFVGSPWMFALEDQASSSSVATARASTPGKG